MDNDNSETMILIHEQFNKIKLLSSDIQIKDQTISILEEKLQEYEESYQNSVKQKEFIERQFQLLQEEHNGMFENSSKKTKHLQEFNQQILGALKEVQESNKHLMEKIKYFENEAGVQEQQKQEISQQLQLLKQSVKELEQDLIASQRSNKSLKKEKASLERDFQQIQSLMQEQARKDMECQSLMSQLDNENEQLKSEVKDFREKMEKQQKELVDLKYVKLQYDEICQQHEEVVQQLNFNVNDIKIHEDKYIQKIEDLNQENNSLLNEINRLKSEFQQNNLKRQDQETRINNLSQFIYDQQEMIQRKMQEILLSKDERKQSVHERLYSQSKKQRKGSEQNLSHSKKGSGRKPKKNDLQLMSNEVIEDFLDDVSAMLQDHELKIKEQNKQLEEYKKQSHLIKQQKDELNTKLEELDKDSRIKQQQLEKQENNLEKKYSKKLLDLQDELEELKDELLKKENQLNNEIKSKNEFCQNILEYQNDNQHLKEQNDHLNQEFENLKKVFLQVQVDVEDIIKRKSEIQNKLALSYGFCHHLLRMIINMIGLNYKEKNQFIQYGYYTLYYSHITSEIHHDSNQNLKKQKIYGRFRKIKNCIVFIFKLKRLSKKIEFEQSDLLKKQFLLQIVKHFQQIKISFNQNDVIDNLIENYLPLYQEKQQQKIDIELSGQLYSELVVVLLEENRQELKCHMQELSQGNLKLEKYIKRDCQLIRNQREQNEYYWKQLQEVQERIISLDKYVGSLEDELRVRRGDEKEKENRELVGNSMPENKEEEVSCQYEVSKGSLQSMSRQLQSELNEILNKRDLARQSSEKRVGKIRRQPVD